MFRYDAKGFALDCRQFSAALGQITLILGSNGSGKTTFLRLLGGWLTPQNGTISTGNLASPDGIKLGWIDVRAATSLVESLTVADHIALSVQAAGEAVPLIPRNAADTFYEHKLAPLGELKNRFRAFLRKPVSDLSFGQRQVLAIALAMLGKRNVLIADESTANLDALNARAFFNAIRSFCSHNGAVIAATHDLRLAAEYGNSFYVVRGGVVRLMQISGTLSDRVNQLENALADANACDLKS